MISVDMNKAKEIAHEIRRADRDEKMKPLDVEATVPALADAAEAQRQIVRDANQVVQSQIEVATSEDELKAALEQL